MAFFCVIALMGIGPFDPILPVITADLDASLNLAELPYTSYLLVTGVSRLVTSGVSSRTASSAR